MDSLKDLLSNKADDIDSSGVRQDVHIVQTELDRHFNGAVTVIAIKQTTLTVATKSAPLASELRLQQTQLLHQLNAILKNDIEKLLIRIT